VNSTIVKISKLYDEVTTPTHATDGSACFDIHAYVPDEHVVVIYDRFNSTFDVPCSSDGISLEPGERILVPTGFRLAIPIGYSVRLHARSGISLKNGVALANSQGIIDADYRKEVFVLLHNTSAEPFRIKHGDRICQGEVVEMVNFQFEEGAVSNESLERVGGFGSTGINN
jgi:dUTP pyrophosphatase